MKNSNLATFLLALAFIALGQTLQSQNCQIDFSQVHNPGQTTITVVGSGIDLYQWSNGQSTQTITVTTAGTYTVTVTDWQGGPCTSVASVNVTVDPPGGPFCSIDFTTSESCGQTTITVVGSGIDLYQWSNGQSTQTITVTTAGTYTVTVTDWQGGPCTATASKTVLVNPLLNPIITANGPTTFCTGGSVTLTASPAQTYLWSNGQSTQSIFVTQPGNYSVMQTNGNCSGTSNVINVNVGQTPTASISGNLNICSGSTTILTASGGNSYQWSNGASSNVVNVGPGTYSVTVSNGPNCTASTSVIVTANQSVNASISGNTSFCQGGSTVLTASGGTTYQWSNGQSGLVITVTTAGTYTVTVTNGNCTGTASKVVTVNPLPILSVIATPNSICLGQSSTLSIINNYGTITVPVSPCTTTTYPFTTTVNGCTTNASVAVTVTNCNPCNNLNITTMATQTTCPTCSDGTVWVNTTGGTAPFTYSWTFNGSPIGLTTEDISGLAAGTYCVTVKDANNCTATSCATVTQPANNPPVAAFTPSTFSGCAPLFVAFLNSSSNATSYDWNFGNGATSTDANTMMSFTTPGMYTVTLTATANGMTNTATQTIIVNNCGGGNPPVADFTQTRVDCGITYLFDASPSLNNPTTFFWDFGAGAVPATSTDEYPVVSFYTKGDKVIKLTVTDGNGNSDTEVRIVNVQGITVNQGILSGGSIEQHSYLTLQAPSGAHYNWGGIGGDVQEIPTLTSTLGVQNFSVTVTQSNGSTAVYCFVVNVVPGVSGGNEPNGFSGKIKTSPNPTNSFVTIEGLELLTPIVVFDEVGRIMSRQQYDGEVDLSLYPAGVYFIAAPGMKTQKVFKGG